MAGAATQEYQGGRMWISVIKTYDNQQRVLENKGCMHINNTEPDESMKEFARHCMSILLVG